MNGDASAVLHALGDDGYLSVCWKKPRGGFEFRVQLLPGALGTITAIGKAACLWYSVGRMAGPPAGGRGTAADVTRLTCLYADLDYEKTPDPAAVIKGLPDPAFIVESGHGQQPIWPVTGPEFTITSPEDRERVAALLRRWGRMMASRAGTLDGKTDSVYDLARILRVPGTINHKYPDKPVPAKLKYRRGAALTWDQAAEIIDGEERDRPAARPAPRPAVTNPVPTGLVGTGFQQPATVYGAEALQGLLDEAQGFPAGRHPWLVRALFRAADLANDGSLDWNTAQRHIVGRFTGMTEADPDRAPQPHEIADAVRDAAAKLRPIAPGTKEEETTRAAVTVTTKEEETTPRMGAAPPAADPAMYTGIAGDIVAAAAPTTEADPVGIYASLLAGAGVAMNATPHVKVGNTRHPLLIWPLLLGRTGSGRKGEANSSASIFLRRAVPESGMFTTSGLSSGEGLIERIRDPAEETQGKALRQPVGTEDKRLLVVETEFYSVLARAKREGSTLGAVMRQAWDGQALNVMNRQQLYASSSHVAIIGHISPQEFRIRLAEADMAGGTYNRFFPLFVERSSRLPIPEGVPEHVVADLGAKLGLAIRQAARSGQLRFGDEARRLWVDELYDEMTAGDDEDLAEAEFTRRAAPYCLRIAGIHAVLDGRREISKGDLRAAGALVRYSIASARYILDRRLRDPRTDRIRRAIEGAGAAGLTQTEVSALFSRNLPTAALEQLLAELLKSGEYEESLRHGRGRPARVYRRIVSSSFVPEEAQ